MLCWIWHWTLKQQRERRGKISNVYLHVVFTNEWMRYNCYDGSTYFCSQHIAGQYSSLLHCVFQKTTHPHFHHRVIFCHDHHRFHEHLTAMVFFRLNWCKIFTKVVPSGRLEPTWFIQDNLPPKVVLLWENYSYISHVFITFVLLFQIWRATVPTAAHSG